MPLSDRSSDPSLPSLLAPLPEATGQYLDHVVLGQSCRDIAKRDGVAPSTVARRIKRLEDRREDPLLNAALTALSGGDPVARLANPISSSVRSERSPMTLHLRSSSPSSTDPRLAKVARRILRRLCETDAVLAVAQDMARAVVLRPRPDGTQTRTAVMAREMAQSFALKDWISCTNPGRVARYTITQAGKAALKRLLEEDQARRREKAGMAEAQRPFQAQHVDWDAREVVGNDGQTRNLRVNANESPLTQLARRKGPDGRPFLGPDLVQAGEKLREDFELAQMGPRVG